MLDAVKFRLGINDELGYILGKRIADRPQGKVILRSEERRVGKECRL